MTADYPSTLFGPRTGLLERLTRRELDQLLTSSEHAHSTALVAIAKAPLSADVLADLAAVAGDCLNMWHEALGESSWRLWHGEPVTAGG